MAKYTIRLPRLPVNWKDQPELFERYWDEAMSQLETSLNAILVLPEIQQAIEEAKDAAQEAKEAADTANAAADGAKTEADVQAKEASIVTSYIQSSGPVLTASSTGVVTISSHTRVYGNSSLNPSVTVASGSLSTGELPGSVVRVYYIDPSRSGGTVSYQYTVDPAPAPVQGGDTHSVGAVVIPDTGDSDGNYVRPPGYVNPNKFATEE